MVPAAATRGTDLHSLEVHQLHLVHDHDEGRLVAQVHQAVGGRLQQDCAAVRDPVEPEGEGGRGRIVATRGSDCFFKQLMVLAKQHDYYLKMHVKRSRKAQISAS